MNGSAQMSSPSQMQQIADDVLVRRLQLGEPSAGDELVQRYAKPLLAYLHRLTGNPVTAEELHQATWLSVLQHVERFESKALSGGFKSWLFRIATNKVNDHWRSRGRQRKAENGLRLVADEVSPDASARMASRENDLKVRNAIAALPEPQRQVVCMRYYANMKFVEIAEALGCPLNTALGRMHKALLKLKEQMG